MLRAQDGVPIGEEDGLLLESKNAVIYGGGRAISGGARTFVRKGAYVFLAGRTREKLEAVAAAESTRDAIAGEARLQ
jgi:NAD(P)-dependent dehydrogenase (short-subunit alcohol dehydrogenase family)